MAYQKKKIRSRTPVSGSRNILTVDAPELTDFKLRWVEDLEEGSRLQTFKDAGYELVNKDEIKSVGDRTVNSSEGTTSAITKVTSFDKRTGKPVLSYLMKQKNEWYSEDQAEKQEDVDRKESSMKSKKDGGQYGSVKIGRGI